MFVATLRYLRQRLGFLQENLHALRALSRAHCLLGLKQHRQIDRILKLKPTESTLRLRATRIGSGVSLCCPRHRNRMSWAIKA